MNKMTEKEIQDKLKKHLVSETPNVLNKIDLDSITIDPKPKKRGFSWPLNLSLSKALMIVLLLITSVVAIPAFFQLLNPNPEIPPVVANSKPMSFDGKLGRVGFSLSGAAELENSQYFQNLHFDESLYLLSSIQKNVFDEVKEALVLVESYAGQIYKTKEHLNDKRNFEYKVEIINESKKTSYFMYYDEHILEEDDDEVESIWIGIVEFKDQHYQFKSEFEIETEDGVEEIEVETTLRKSSSEEVIIKQSKELDEYQFEYEIYLDGKKVKSFELEVEIEDGKIEISLEMEFEGVEYEFEFKLKDNGYDVEYKSDDEEGMFEIIKTESGYTFIYNDERIEY